MKRLLILFITLLPVCGRAQEATPLPTAPVSAPSLSNLAGHWSVYKRTADKPQTSVDYTRQIKSVHFFDAPKDGMFGYFYAGMDAETAPSWHIQSYSADAIILNGKDKREFSILKAAPDEMILKEAGTTYFLKQFHDKK